MDRKFLEDNGVDVKTGLELLGDIFEYDSVVNEFFLPVLKNKLENPKDDYKKKLRN